MGKLVDAEEEVIPKILSLELGAVKPFADEPGLLGEIIFNVLLG